MLVQELCKAVYISLFQLKAHQNRYPLDLIKHLHRIRVTAHIAAYNIAQQVSCKPALSGINQAESLV